MLTLLSALSMGCLGHDYSLEAEAFWVVTPTSPPPVELSFLAVFQRGEWGFVDTGCQVELAFYEMGESDGYGSGPDGQVVEIPEKVGACEVTVFDLEDDMADGAVSVRGSLDAGPEIWLVSDTTQLLLERELDQEGMTYYRLGDCSAETFPFGDLLDLVVDGSDDEVEGVGPLIVEEALGVGPDMQFITPTESELFKQYLKHDQDTDLEVTWGYLGDIPPAPETGEDLGRNITAMVRNQDDQMQLLEAIACVIDPAVGAVVIPADAWYWLTADEGDEDIYSSSFQIDSQYTGPEFEVPGGQLARMSSMISIGGQIDLRATED